MKTTKTLQYLIIVGLLLAQGCRTIPKGATPVSPFETSKYLGEWYEIARMDFKFEKGLNNTTANYSLREDGKLKVLNKGYNYTKKEWKESEGKAKFKDDKNTAALLVSFFGPFYTGYNVVELDPEYRYALVIGKNKKFMWILSRSTLIPEEVKSKYLQTAKGLGYETDKLIWVEHDRETPSISPSN